MTIIAIGMLYCFLHFIFFIAWLGSGRRSEFSVLIFHIFSFLLLSFSVFMIYHSEDDHFIFISGIIALHGIYSLSVLELYSLSQGSYAISILKSLKNNPQEKFKIIKDFHKLGEQKRIFRIEGLRKYFIMMENGKLKLTALGFFASRAIILLRFLANIVEAA